MACYHPSKVDVERHAPGGQRRPEAVTVPCGSCIGCRMDQARQWATRMQHESEYPYLQPTGFARGTYFATLTYDDEYLPGPDRGGVTHGSLLPSDATAFLARLRKRYPAKTLSYYLCGEYGETSDRPHYHAVFFGPQFLDRDLHHHRNGAPVWIAQAIQDAWGLGITELTPCNTAAFNYVAGYVRKKVRRKDDPTYYERVDPETGEIGEVEPEFARMSRRPAIGRRWLEEYWPDVYPRDFVVIDGYPRKPPRYYDKVMDDIAPTVMEEVRHQRWLDAEEIGDDKLIMMEKVHRARIGLFNRRFKV